MPVPKKRTRNVSWFNRNYEIEFVFKMLIKIKTDDIFNFVWEKGLLLLCNPNM